MLPLQLPSTYPLSSDRVVVVVEVDVPWTPRVAPHKLLVARRSLVLRVARQHALNAHAYTLDVLDGTPALTAEQIETDDAVGIDMRVYWDRTVGGTDKGDFWGFCDRQDAVRNCVEVGPSQGTYR